MPGITTAGSPSRMASRHGNCHANYRDGVMSTSVTVLDHIAVTVSDLDRSLRFYRDLLGMREVERHRLEGDTISTMAGKPGVVMQVVRLVAPETPGIQLDLQQYLTPKGKVSDAKLGDSAHAHFC